jgi:dipeptidyl aminopeptidase/acylaminoacyl peptidase
VVCQLLGGPIEEKTELAKAASPLTYVSKDAASFLIMHGTADNLVPLEQAEVLHAALKKAGADSTFVKVVGAGHGFGGPEVQKRVQAFFDKHLRGQAVEVSAEPISAKPSKKK